MANELFEKAPIHKAYLKLAIPVVLSMVVQVIQVIQVGLK